MRYKGFRELKTNNSPTHYGNLGWRKIVETERWKAHHRIEAQDYYPEERMVYNWTTMTCMLVPKRVDFEEWTRALKKNQASKSYQWAASNYWGPRLSSARKARSEKLKAAFPDYRIYDYHAYDGTWTDTILGVYNKRAYDRREGERQAQRERKSMMLQIEMRGKMHARQHAKYEQEEAKRLRDERRTLREKANRTLAEWDTWLDDNGLIIRDGIHMFTTDVGDFVFTIQEGTLQSARNVSTRSAGSDIWRDGKIISRNNGDLVVLPYTRASDGKHVNGYTRRREGQEGFKARTAEEEILWNQMEGTL